MKRPELVAVLAVALLISACGDESTTKAATDNSAPAPAERASEPSQPTASAGTADEARQGELPRSLFGEEYSLDAGDPLAEADLDGVQFHIEPTTNNFASAHQLAYLRAVQARWQARQTEAMLASNRSVYAAVEDPEQQKIDARIADGLKGSAAPNAPAPASAAVPQIDEAAVLADPKGQWAMRAQASSYYGGDNGARPRYGAIQVTGAPDVPQYSDSPNSWVAKADGVPTAEWLLLDYATAVHASAVKVRQNMGPGAVSKLELLDEAGTAHTVWEGLDEAAYPKNTTGWFVREFPATDYLVKQVRVSLRNNRVWGYNEIDAVQLVGAN